MKSHAVIYHADWDGLVAAWCAEQFISQDPANPPVRFEMTNYNRPPLAFDEKLATLYILDFSYPREEIERLSKIADEVILLDHHKTAKEEYADWIPPLNCFVSVNMEKAGAQMAWDHFFPEEEKTPPLVAYVADRDLWLFQLPDSKEINAGIHTYSLTLESCSALYKRMNKDGLGWLKELGTGIIAYQESQISLAIHHAEEFEIDDYRVRGAQVPFPNLISEVAGRLAEGRPFGLCWFKARGDKWIYSLRSRENGVDVSVVAKKFGGGGHVRAAGFDCSNPPTFFLVEDKTEEGKE
jgi:oligoribonuclease NrnB/cAMP/cGMP phosphodiesterase (DHH superfamily)